MKTTPPSRSTQHHQPAPQNDLHALMKENAAADFCGVTPRTLQGFRLKGRGPRFVKISARCIRYRKVDLIEWQESLLVQSTSENKIAMEGEKS